MQKSWFYAKNIKFSDGKRNIPLLGHQTVFQEAILPVGEIDNLIQVSKNT